MALSGKLDQECTEAPERLAHQFKIFRHGQEPSAYDLEHVARIVGRRRFLALKLGAPVMAGFGCAKRPDDITVLAAGHVIVLFALSEVTTAPEADLVMDAG
jgi:hypothetical protein